VSYLPTTAAHVRTSTRGEEIKLGQGSGLVSSVRNLQRHHIGVSEKYAQHWLPHVMASRSTFRNLLVLQGRQDSMTKTLITYSSSSDVTRSLACTCDSNAALGPALKPLHFNKCIICPSRKMNRLPNFKGVFRGIGTFHCKATFAGQPKCPHWGFPTPRIRTERSSFLCLYHSTQCQLVAINIQ
jgi:hypothetical protein